VGCPQIAGREKTMLKRTLCLGIAVLVMAVCMAGYWSQQASSEECEKEKVKRFGQVIRVKADKLEEYKKYHAAVWPEVLEMIEKCNIRNYSIYHKEGFLFAYMEYTGDDFDADMKKMADHKKTQEWWEVMEPMQQPLDTRAEGEWWADMEEVFHLD
jgi:L-rhamnose mutarotase